MKQPSKPHVSSFYASILIYVAFIFTTQWSLAAAKSGSMWLHDMLSGIVVFLLLPIIVSLLIHSIAMNFSYYYKRKWFTIVFICTLLIIASASKSLSLTIPLLMGFAGFAANNRKIAKAALISFSMFLILSYILSVAGLNGGDTVSKPLFGTDRTETMDVTAIGMANPNAVMLIVFNITSLALILCKTKKQDVVSTALLLVLVISLSFATGSTTGIIIGIAAIASILYAKNTKKGNRLISSLAPWMFTIITAATFIISIGFGSTGGNEGGINDMLTGRPELWNMRIENGSYINIYGNNDQYQVNRPAGSNQATQALDNTPLYILVYLGIIVYLLFWYIFYNGARGIKEPAILAYVIVATILMFTEKMELYGIVLLFLQKSITESKLMRGQQVSGGDKYA